MLEGELDVLYEDDEIEGRLLHFLNSDNERIPLRFENGDAPDLPSGSRERVTGNLADGTVTTTSVTTIAVSASRTLEAIAERDDLCMRPSSHTTSDLRSIPHQNTRR